MAVGADEMIFDFSSPQNVDAWHAIDDRIMGGASQSRADHVDGSGLRFTGTVSLENNGGFASIRSADAAFDLGGFQGLFLRVRGDGKTYKLSLRTDDFFDGVSYQGIFATDQDHWQEIVLPFPEFRPTHHGIALTTVAPMDAASIRSFGLFIADGQVGPFQLDIAWIKGWQRPA